MQRNNDREIVEAANHKIDVSIFTILTQVPRGRYDCYRVDDKGVWPITEDISDLPDRYLSPEEDAALSAMGESLQFPCMPSELVEWVKGTFGTFQLPLAFIEAVEAQLKLSKPEAAHNQVQDGPKKVVATTVSTMRSSENLLSRTAIRSLFPEISATEWRGVFNREKINGLAACRGEDATKVLYQPEKLAQWIINKRQEVIPAEVKKRLQVDHSPAQPAQSQSFFPTAHNPFGIKN
jgi:hypothetical protein